MPIVRGWAGQGSLEYLLLLAGVVLSVLVVFYILLLNAIPQSKNILEHNIQAGQETLGTEAGFEPPLTALDFSVAGGIGEVLLYFNAPGADAFKVVREKDGTFVVGSLIDPEDFDGNFTNPNVLVWEWDSSLQSPVKDNSGIVSGATYYYKLRACDLSGFCLVSNLEWATPT